MPMLIDEVSVDVEREAPRGSTSPEPANSAPAQDPREQVERQLRLLAERQARVGAE